MRGKEASSSSTRGGSGANVAIGRFEFPYFVPLVGQTPVEEMGEEGVRFGFWFTHRAPPWMGWMMAAAVPDRRERASLQDLFRRPLPARLGLPAGRGAPVEEKRDTARCPRAASEPRSPSVPKGIAACRFLRSSRMVYYQAPAKRVVDVSAYGDKV